MAPSIITLTWNALMFYPYMQACYSDSDMESQGQLRRSLGCTMTPDVQLISCLKYMGCDKSHCTLLPFHPGYKKLTGGSSACIRLVKLMILTTRRSSLIFTTGFPMLVSLCLFDETGPPDPDVIVDIADGLEPNNQYNRQNLAKLISSNHIISQLFKHNGTWTKSPPLCILHFQLH